MFGILKGFISVLNSNYFCKRTLLVLKYEISISILTDLKSVLIKSFKPDYVGIYAQEKKKINIYSLTSLINLFLTLL